MSIKTEIGQLKANASTQYNFGVGDQVYCSIRPEAVQFGLSEDQSEVNRFQATSRNITYLGQTEEYELAVGLDHSSEVTIKSILYNPSPSLRPTSDENSLISCYVVTEDVIVLPPDKPESGENNFDPT